MASNISYVIKPEKWSLNAQYLRKYRDRKEAKFFHMLSEYIDNCISGYKNTPESLAEKVKDDFLFNVNGLEVKLYFIEKNMYIVDNGTGMVPMILKAALNFSNTNEKLQTSNLNMNGVGLKEASFYFSEWLSVYTKAINYPLLSKNPKNFDYTVGVNFNLINRVDVNLFGKPDSFEPEYGIFTQTTKDIENDLKQIESDKLYKGIKFEKNIILSHFTKPNSRGTVIALRNCYPYKFSETKISELDKILGWKYKRFIDAGMKISIFVDSDINSSLVKSYSPRSQNILEWRDEFIEIHGKELSDDQKKNYETTTLKNTFEKRITDIVKNRAATYKNVDWKPYLDQIFNENKKGNLLLSYSHSFYVHDDYGNLVEPKVEQTITGAIGYLRKDPINNKLKESSQTDNNGFTMYQFGRAIKSGPNGSFSASDESDSGTWSNNKIIPRQTGGKNPWESRRFGWFDFSNATAISSVDPNKKNIELHDSIKDQFITSILDEYKKMDLIIEVLHYLQLGKEEVQLPIEIHKQTGLGVEHESDIIKYIQEQEKEMEDRYIRDLKENKITVYETKYSIIDKSTKLPFLKVNVLLNLDDVENFIDHKISEEEISVTLFIKHPIWNPLLSREKDVPMTTQQNISLHKLAISLGLSFFITHTIQNPNKNDTETVRQLLELVKYDENVHNSLQDYLNYITRSLFIDGKRHA